MLINLEISVHLISYIIHRLTADYEDFSALDTTRSTTEDLAISLSFDLDLDIDIEGSAGRSGR